MKSFILLIAAAFSMILSACNNENNQADASGTFEAEEIIISAEATGIIKEFQVQEGMQLASGQLVGYIDSTQLYLRKKQMEEQILAVLSKRPDVAVQLSALKEQLSSAERDQQRINNLVKVDAATTKQLDDVNAQVAVIKKQIEAMKSSLQITSEGINKETGPLDVQIEQLNDQLQKSKIINPINGTILTKYAEQDEMAVVGKALYKIADLSKIILRAYITGDQLPVVKLNQNVKVLTDDGKGGFNETTGTISWISDKAEFTPKTIQTKNERANQVYAVKILVKNNGDYKIGMYGEIKFE